MSAYDKIWDEVVRNNAPFLLTSLENLRTLTTIDNLGMLGALKPLCALEEGLAYRDAEKRETLLGIKGLDETILKIACDNRAAEQARIKAARIVSHLWFSSWPDLRKPYCRSFVRKSLAVITSPSRHPKEYEFALGTYADIANVDASFAREMIKVQNLVPSFVQVLKSDNKNIKSESKKHALKALIALAEAVDDGGRRKLLGTNRIEEVWDGKHAFPRLSSSKNEISTLRDLLTPYQSKTTNASPPSTPPQRTQTPLTGTVTPPETSSSSSSSSSSSASSTYFISPVSSHVAAMAAFELKYKRTLRELGVMTKEVERKRKDEKRKRQEEHEARVKEEERKYAEDERKRREDYDAGMKEVERMRKEVERKRSRDESKHREEHENRVKENERKREYGERKGLEEHKGRIRSFENKLASNLASFSSDMEGIKEGRGEVIEHLAVTHMDMFRPRDEEIGGGGKGEKRKREDREL